MKISQKQLDLEHSCSFISLRGTPQPSALQTKVECNRGALRHSAQEAAGVSRSEIKEETAKPAGDIRGGARPPPIARGTTATKHKRSTKWAN